jgi:hypothetical protein
MAILGLPMLGVFLVLGDLPVSSAAMATGLVDATIVFLAVSLGRLASAERVLPQLRRIVAFAAAGAALAAACVCYLRGWHPGGSLGPLMVTGALVGALLALGVLPTLVTLAVAAVVGVMSYRLTKATAGQEWAPFLAVALTGVRFGFVAWYAGRHGTAVLSHPRPAFMIGGAGALVLLLVRQRAGVDGPWVDPFVAGAVFAAVAAPFSFANRQRLHGPWWAGTAHAAGLALVCFAAWGYWRDLSAILRIGPTASLLAGSLLLIAAGAVAAMVLPRTRLAPEDQP